MDHSNDLLQYWRQSIAVEARQDEKGRPIARGAFRVELGKLLAAVGHTLRAAKEIPAALATIGGWVLVAAEGFAALAALREAVFDKLSPIQYLALVVVSTSPGGMTEQEVQNGVDFFVSELEPGILPGYLWIDDRFLHQCRDNLAETDALKNVLRELLKRSHVRLEDGRYYQNEAILRWSLGVA